MKKLWWSKFNKVERQYITFFLKNKNGGRVSYYPDDCLQCGVCGCPSVSSPCPSCYEEFTRLIESRGEEVPNV